MTLEERNLIADEIQILASLAQDILDELTHLAETANDLPRSDGDCPH